MWPSADAGRTQIQELVERGGVDVVIESAAPGPPGPAADASGFRGIRCALAMHDAVAAEREGRGPEKLRQVLEASLYVTDLDAAEIFYASVLGLTLHSRLEGRHVFFRCGSQMVLLFNPEATTDPDPAPRGLGAHGAHGPGHLAFGVEAREIDIWRAHLESHGIEIEQEVEWGGSRGRSIYFRDPDGNSLEFATAALWGLDR